MIGALLAIGLTGPAIVLSGHALDLIQASTLPPATAPDVEPPA
ncbi:hypothetical protein ACWGIU_03420 [Streptomyces sp. NPDC054840]